MTKLTTTSPELTMTSLEIAERAGKLHKNVLQDIREILHQLGEGTELKFQLSYQDSTGRTLPMFALPERELMILLTGYNVPLRAKVIDRWRELEEQFKRTKEEWELYRLNVKAQFKILANAVDENLVKPFPDMDKRKVSSMPTKPMNSTRSCLG